MYIGTHNIEVSDLSRNVLCSNVFARQNFQSQSLSHQAA